MRVAASVRSPNASTCRRGEKTRSLDEERCDHAKRQVMKPRAVLLVVLSLVGLALLVLMLARGDPLVWPDPQAAASATLPVPAVGAIAVAAVPDPNPRTLVVAGAADRFAAEAIYGCVRRVDGALLPSATVTLLPGAPGPDRAPRPALATVTTDDDGRFRFTPCAPFRPHELRVQAEGRLPGRFAAEAGRNLDLMLAAAAALHGQVFEGDPARPVARARLSFEHGQPPVLCQTECDAEGRYRFAAAPAGEPLSLAVQRPGGALERFPLATEVGRSSRSRRWRSPAHRSRCAGTAPNWMAWRRRGPPSLEPPRPSALRRR